MRISESLLQKIETEALNAYPREACGLLVGKAGEILEVIPSPNLADEDDEFMVDPALQIRTKRALRPKSLAVLGVYHSHPSGESSPSARDAKGAANPGFFWIITAISPKKAKKSALFVEKMNPNRPNSRNFEKVPLQILKNSV